MESGNQQQRDIDLLKLWRQDPERGFTELRQLYLPMVWSLCLRLLQNQSLAEDACQESFVRIWRNLNSFEERSKLSTWIWTITSRCCQDQHRREMRPERTGNIESADANHPDSPRQHSHDFAREDLISRLLGKLSFQDREMVLLYYMENHSVDEISQITGRGKSAIKTALHRVRKQMARQVQTWEAQP